MNIVDAHLHLYDSQAIPHPHLNHPDALFESLLGDYSSLPRTYLWEDYTQDTNAYDISGIVWHEFVSATPNQEIQWASDYLNQLDIASAMVAKVDFSEKDFVKNLEFLQQYPRVTAIRQHMAYHPYDRLKQFCPHNNYFQQKTWHNNIARLAHTPLKCGLEIFSNQFDELINVIRMHPQVGFTVSLFAWPYDSSTACFKAWQHSLQRLTSLDNFCIGLDGQECIFGMNWDAKLVTPWLDSLIDIIGIERCMFGSHAPISKLSLSFAELLQRYEELFPGLSATEKAQFYSETAINWFGLKP